MGSAITRLQPEEKEGKIIKFPTSTEIKLKKDGTPKMTPCNAKQNRDNVYPFTVEDVSKMVAYFKDKIVSSKNDEDKMISTRNLALFIIGINIGLRCSDLVALKWSDVFDKDWNFLAGKKIKPKKTARKNKHVLLKYNTAFKRAILDYKNERKPKSLDEYIFESRQGGHIEVRSAGKTIKTAAISVGVKYNVNTHSMRKTFARTRYDHSSDKSKTLVDLMTLFNHEDLSTTKEYICVREDEIEVLYDSVNLGYDDEPIMIVED